ncbi:hypothetical protein BKA62DRAFT_716107 [Auriculariales sp. MPI-PUGE-AT-0066]|nr:hypothetical protein BKA62DRAFT_716107 [Auriculariales sp. MPI-PUGE-AT-0066]
MTDDILDTKDVLGTHWLVVGANGIGEEIDRESCEVNAMCPSQSFEETGVNGPVFMLQKVDETYTMASVEDIRNGNFKLHLGVWSPTRDPTLKFTWNWEDEQGHGTSTKELTFGANEQALAYWTTPCSLTLNRTFFLNDIASTEYYVNGEMDVSTLLYSDLPSRANIHSIEMWPAIGDTLFGFNFTSEPHCGGHVRPIQDSWNIVAAAGRTGWESIGRPVLAAVLVGALLFSVSRRVRKWRRAAARGAYVPVEKDEMHQSHV